MGLAAICRGMVDGYSLSGMALAIGLANYRRPFIGGQCRTAHRANSNF